MKVNFGPPLCIFLVFCLEEVVNKETKDLIFRFKRNHENSKEINKSIETDTRNETAADDDLIKIDTKSLPIDVPIKKIHKRRKSKKGNKRTSGKVSDDSAEDQSKENLDIIKEKLLSTDITNDLSQEKNNDPTTDSGSPNSNFTLNENGKLLKEEIDNQSSKQPSPKEPDCTLTKNDVLKDKISVKQSGEEKNIVQENCFNEKEIVDNDENIKDIDKKLENDADSLRELNIQRLALINKIKKSDIERQKNKKTTNIDLTDTLSNEPIQNIVKKPNKPKKSSNTVLNPQTNTKQKDCPKESGLNKDVSTKCDKLSPPKKLLQDTEMSPCKKYIMESPIIPFKQDQSENKIKPVWPKDNNEQNCLKNKIDYLNQNNQWEAPALSCEQQNWQQYIYRIYVDPKYSKYREYKTSDIESPPCSILDNNIPADLRADHSNVYYNLSPSCGYAGEYEVNDANGLNIGFVKTENHHSYCNNMYKEPANGQSNTNGWQILQQVGELRTNSPPSYYPMSTNKAANIANGYIINQCCSSNQNHLNTPINFQYTANDCLGPTPQHSFCLDSTAQNNWRKNPCQIEEKIWRTWGNTKYILSPDNNKKM